MKISGWFIRNNRLKNRLHDLRGQLTFERDDKKFITEQWNKEAMRADSLQAQLHRVARERDNERKLRLEAEHRLLDRYLENAENEEE